MECGPDTGLVAIGKVFRAHKRAGEEVIFVDA